MTMSVPSICWQPSKEFIENCEMTQFMAWLKAEGHGEFLNYDELYSWSIEHKEKFWEALALWGELQYEGEYTSVLQTTKSKPGFGASWFEGATLNFARNLLHYWMQNPHELAVRSVLENDAEDEVTGKKLIAQVAAFANFLTSIGVKKGDRVAGVCSNTIEPIVAMLATTSLGAVWASCSPDFGVDAVLDRFAQIEPTVLIAVDGYQYGGKTFHCLDKVNEIADSLKTIKAKVLIHQISMKETDWNNWASIVTEEAGASLEFKNINFNDPVYILFSSGTTGKPKCIVHGAGGVLLQHLKELRLHTNITSRDRFMYYTTTGWMMWNWLVSGLMTGACLVLYDGSPIYSSFSRLWEFVEKENITVFGTSAKFISACRNQKDLTLSSLNLKNVRCILSTGSPLVPEDFDWIYENLSKEVQLASISGGTDIVSCFLLGNPLVPVYRGELQCRGLGMDVRVYSDEGKEVIDEVGELVCKSPAPSMPIFFWNDETGEKYTKAYFNTFENTWRHGDFIQLTSRGSAIIYGRSDSTLNPGGIRIGTAEIYRIVEDMDEVVDSLVVGVPHEGDVEVRLFVVLPSGAKLTDELSSKIKTELRKKASPRHVPKVIHMIEEVPYTASGKKVEIAVTKILQGQGVENRSALKNPKALDQFSALQ